MSRIWLIPGLDGTGRLHAPLKDAILRAAPETDVRAIGYVGGTYDACFASLPEALREAGPDDVLVGESFSGPLALRVATERSVRRVVLVASFVEAPLGVPPGRWIAPFLPPPALAVRALMVGWNAPSALVREVQESIAETPAAVLARRLDAVRELKGSPALAGARAPVIWLRAASDRLLSPSATATAMAARPDIEVIDVAGPHLLAQRFPERVVPFLLS